MTTQLPPPPALVLLVEDDEDTRELYRTVLTLEGFWVADVADARSAVDEARTLRPDLIITDIALPGARDGVGLVDRLQADAKTADVPVLALTGRPVSDLAGRGFNDVLQKPVLPDELISAVRRLLANSRVLRERAGDARARVPYLRGRSESLLGRAADIMRSIESRRRSRDDDEQ